MYEKESSGNKFHKKTDLNVTIHENIIDLSVRFDVIFHANASNINL